MPKDPSITHLKQRYLASKNNTFLPKTQGSRARRSFHSRHLPPCPNSPTESAEGVPPNAAERIPNPGPRPKLAKQREGGADAATAWARTRNGRVGRRHFWWRPACPWNSNIRTHQPRGPRHRFRGR